MHITLAEDDTRRTYPAYGLDLHLPLSSFRLLQTDNQGMVKKKELYIRGLLVEEWLVISVYGEASKFPITLYPFDP